MDRRTICFVLPSLHGGGAERAAVQILNALDPAIWERSMYLFRREGPYLETVDAGIQLTTGDDASRAGRWLGLRRYLRRARPQLVVAFLSYFSVLTAVRAAGTGTRVVFNLQTPMSDFLTDADYHWRSPWHRRAMSAATRLGYRQADAIIATSSGVADDLVSRFRVGRDRIRVLHNPVDLDAIDAAVREPIEGARSAGPAGPIIVAAGRLADAKNYPLMLQAVALLRRTLPVRLLILGQGDREAAIRDEIASLGLADAVTLGGFQRNPWKFIARADLFVLSSRYEGFGNVLIEAMACGVPVVATSSPGTREIVDHGVNGLLVDAHEPAALARALECVLADRPLRDRMAAHARRSAGAYALPAIAAAYGRALAEVMA